MNVEKIILTEYKGFDACFKYENDTLTDLILEKDLPISVQDIYVGRVSMVKQDIKACFVEIKSSVMGFLPFSAVKPEGLLNRKYDGRLIQGDEILVSVASDRIKTKEYTLTMDISIAGIYSVCTMFDSSVRVSSKISKSDAEELKRKYLPMDKSIGFLLRTNSSDADEEIVKKEHNENISVLKNICATAGTRVVFSQLYSGKRPFYNRVIALKNIVNTEIVTDNDRLYEEFSAFKNIRKYNDSFPLKTVYSFDRAYDEASNKKVDLKCGGYLIIEPTEALTVIDVNSGKFDKKMSKDEANHQVNKEACIEVCRQLRLRNISGIIIVDFINTSDFEKKKELELLIKHELKKDSLKAGFVDFTGLSLCEITREKKFPSIYERLKKNC